MAMLIEQNQGAWPFWLSPRQVSILAVNQSNALTEYAEKVKSILTNKQHYHIDIDSGGETISNRIRKHTELNVNYIAVIGDKEVANNTINIRDRSRSQFVTTATEFQQTLYQQTLNYK